MTGPNLLAGLKKHLIQNTSPGQGEYASVRQPPLEALAGETGQPLSKIMARCLEAGIWPERFRAHRGTFSAAEQSKLLGSTVAIIGAGGLGGSVCLLLARAGVGHLVICDGDSFDESNLNRQFLSRMDRLGQNKALMAQEEIKAINPAVTVNVWSTWATTENLPVILESAQVVVDCLDNLPMRYHLEAAARARGIPMVHGAIAGLEALVMTVHPGGPGLANLYGPTPAAKKDSAESFVGVPTVTPAITAGLQVTEVLNILLSRRPPTSRLLHLDLSIPEIEINPMG